MSKAAELANLIGNINAGGGGANKNLIINGNFVVAQRGTSFSNVTSSQFCLDRFSVDVSGGGAFNVTQDTSAPEGFEKSLKLEVNTADSSIAAGDAYRITQAIEGQNIAQVDLGASTAKAMALSFYVKSSVTGTYGVGLANSAETENFVAEYTINSADTWEKKTINIPARTSGTWLTTIGVGIGVRFDLGSGTNYNGTAGQWQTTSAKVYRTSSCVNLIATGSATWFLTGVQLEVGQNPTSFEHEPFQKTFEKCLRYTRRLPAKDSTSGSGFNGLGSGGKNDTTTLNHTYVYMEPHMRDDPAIASQSGSFRIHHANTATSVSASISIEDNLSGVSHVCLLCTVSSGLTAGQAALCGQSNDPDAHVIIESEL
jgi:hypothetical protein